MYALNIQVRWNALTYAAAYQLVTGPVMPLLYRVGVHGQLRSVTQFGHRLFHLVALFIDVTFKVMIAGFFFFSNFSRMNW